MQSGSGACTAGVEKAVICRHMVTIRRVVSDWVGVRVALSFRLNKAHIVWYWYWCWCVTPVNSQLQILEGVKLAT